MRLSWPLESDKRRAIVLLPKTPLSSRTSGPSSAHDVKVNVNVNVKVSEARFVHVSHWDIERHNSLTSTIPAYERPFLHVPVTWNPSRLKVLDRDLIDYFRCEASQSLPIFGHDPTRLGSILIRIALASNTPSAAAVLQSLLAFASLHRNGVQSQAIELKIDAIGNMAESSRLGSLSTSEAIQHVIAGMLLCCFEIHQASCTSDHWTGYLGRVKQVIDASCTGALQHDTDLAVVLDWVRYHDVMARFSLRHWQRKTTETEIASTPIILCTEVSKMPPSALAILELLSQICESVFAGTTVGTSFDNMDEYKGFLSVLEWRIRNIPVSTGFHAGDNAHTDATLVMQLYQLAMLVYLGQACESLLNQPVTAIRTQQHVKKAFAIIPQLSSCERQFPIFIMGCEARTDEQRVIILDLVSRTEKKGSSRSFNQVKHLIQAIWAQDDLAVRDISYWNKLTSIITSCLVTPTFV